MEYLIKLLVVGFVILNNKLLITTRIINMLMYFKIICIKYYIVIHYYNIIETIVFKTLVMKLKS